MGYLALSLEEKEKEVNGRGSVPKDGMIKGSTDGEV